MSENYPTFPFRFRESNIAVATKTVVLSPKKIIIQFPTQTAVPRGTYFLPNRK